MRLRLLVLAVTAALLGEGGARAQKIQSPAELFSAKTLAYGEIRQPGQLAKEVRGLFEGSVLGNVPTSLDKLRDKLTKAGVSPWELQPLGAFGLALAPEVTKEISRLKGAGVGLMGIDKHGEPEFLAVVLPGDSQAPAFFMRAFLTMAPVHAVGKVEGVTIYQAVERRFQRVDRPFDDKKDGPPPAPRLSEVGPAVAMMPGALFIGTPEAVKDAIRRAKGKAQEESLGKSEAFQEASKDAGTQPGLFAFVNVPGMAEFILEQARPHPLKPRAGAGAQEQAEVEAVQAERKRMEEAIAALTKLLNPKAFRSLAYSLTLSKGTLRYREMARLDPKEKSPLLELLPATPVNTELLHFAPKDATAVAALSNGDGEKRWTRLLEVIDTIDQLMDNTPKQFLPSQHMKKLEEALKISIAKDVAGKISNVAVAVGDLWNAPVKKVVEKGPGFESVSISPQIPVVVIVQATDEDAARKLTELLPQVCGLLKGKNDVKPATKQVGGQTIAILPLGRHEALHYGRHGSTIVLGPYQKPVAQALADGAAQKGWLATAKDAAVLTKLKDPLLVAVVKPVSCLGAGLLMRGHGHVHSEARPIRGGIPDARPDTKPSPNEADKGDDKAPPPRPERKVTVTVTEGPADHDETEVRLKKELGKLLAGEEPLVVNVTRTDERIQAEATVGGLKPLVARLTDFAIEKLMPVRRVGAQRLEEKRRFDFEKRTEPEKREK
jgi:hypothetical protein